MAKRNKQALKLAKECVDIVFEDDKRIPKDVVCKAFRNICFLAHPQPECNRNCEYFAYRKAIGISWQK